MDRHETGIYICEANNGVGMGKVKAEAQINLQVLCEHFFHCKSRKLLPFPRIKNALFCVTVQLSEKAAWLALGTLNLFIQSIYIIY